ncbi:hypothetical protein PRK78_005041 [Emydomyces testavorans]|uniref:DUF8035 domain-containing protein n=1 Tax=Emydomyces testavorans TaxID=2070801 RepID=A0AAF0DJ32_9EURO|nr:hypothetical protein PRK78_005041 [Emydomyces testavorans]
MSRYGDTASSTRGSSVGGAGGGRWDAERFLRERGERHEPSRRERRSAVEVMERDRVEKRGPSIVEEYLHAQETYGPPARRPDRDYDDEHLVSSSGALVPVQQRRHASPAPPRKPKLLRRQSSLDTFDRAATRLASDYYRYDRDDYGPPVIPVAVPRKHSPSSESYFESIRIAEPDYYGDEEFRSIRERDRSVPRGRRYTLREEIVKEKVERPYPRRGKTRIPRHLIHPHALADLGYHYEEEGDNIIVLQALGKDNIDELIRFSKEIRKATRVEEIKERERVVTKTRRESVSVERHRSQSRRRSPSVIRPKIELVDTREARYTRHVSPSPARTEIRRTRPRRLSSPIRVMEPRHRYVEEIIQPNTDMRLILPERHRRNEIRSEVQLLDADKLEPGEVLEVRRDYKEVEATLYVERHQWYGADGVIE